MKSTLRPLLIALAIVCLGVPCAQASVVVAGTRVVFPAGQGQTTVRLINQNDRPALVEAWIDAGDLHSTPDSAHTPFLITPPLFRMNARKEQNLRILFTPNGKALPTDRETLFWLNVLEIPPKPTGEAALRNHLSFALRSRLKLFYRPANLPGSARKAPEQLSWSVVAAAHGNKLHIHNPTPYYVTLSQVSLETADHKTHKVGTGMVAPFSDLSLSIKDLTRPVAAGATVHFTTINDFGAADTHQGMTQS